MRPKYFSLLGAIITITFASEASAIPSFSRQTNMACQSCHAQHLPILNGFGQAFKAAGYTMMGTQDLVTGDRLSLPAHFYASMKIKARYQKSNGSSPDAIPGDTTNSGQFQAPEEFNLYFGGRIAEGTGFLFEGDTTAHQLFSGFRLPVVYQNDSGKLSVIPFMTDKLGASYGFEQSSTGAARNIRWAEHRKEISAQQYAGTDSAATGVAFVAQNDFGYINFSRWAPGFMARSGAAQTLRSNYLRIAATPTVITAPMGDWAMHIGAQYWGGSNYAYDSLTPVTPASPTGPGAGPGLVPVDTRANSLDFQAFGKVGGRDLAVYATWARSPGGSLTKPNILNADNEGGNPPGPAEPTLYRAHDREAWTIGAEYSLLPNRMHLGAAYRSANTGGATLPLAATSNPTDNALTLTFVYNLSQNAEVHLNHSQYSGTLYNLPQSDANGNSKGNQLTTIMLEASW